MQLSDSQLTYVTVQAGPIRTDVAVTFDTTVAGALALCGLNTARSESQVSLSDGTPAELSQSLGTDIPSGAVLTVSGMSDPVKRKGIIKREGRSELPLLPFLICLLLGTGTAVGLIAVPLLTGDQSFPALWRYLVAGALLALGTMLMVGRVALSGAPQFFLVPLTVAVAGLLVVDPTRSIFPISAMVVALWLGAVASVIQHILHGTAASFAATILWISITIFFSIGIGAGLPLAQLAIISFGIMAIILAVIPAGSVQVPDFQLLDLPALTSVSVSIRSPELRSPGRITHSRVLRVVTDARGVQSCVVVAVSVMAVLCAPYVALIATTDGISGIAAICELVMVLAVFTFCPRQEKLSTARVAPRIAVTLILAEIAISLMFFTEISLPWGLVFLGLGLVVLAGAFVLLKSTGSVLLGHLADIVQRLSIALSLPAAVVAAGLFDAMRQAS